MERPVKHFTKYVTLDHKTICVAIANKIIWVKMIIFSFMPKIIRMLNKDHVP